MALSRRVVVPGGENGLRDRAWLLAPAGRGRGGVCPRASEPCRGYGHGNCAVCAGSQMNIENSTRRGFLAVVSVAGLKLALEAIPALAQPASERPKEGDLLVSIESESTSALEPKDVPLGGPPLLAWPMDAAAKTVRKDSRLNKIRLLRLDPSTLAGGARGAAARGGGALSRIGPPPPP